MADTIVLGAGAAGLMCAMTAAQRGRKVLVIERSNKPGKKILMSGGGRCNFTNLHIGPDRYVSANPHFCKSALNRYTQWDFIDLVERHGIEWVEKDGLAGPSGQLFCRGSSKQIVALLMDECHRAGVEVLMDCECGPVEQPGAYRLESNQGRYEAETLVVATGGLSVPSLGGSPYGYRVAEQFGLDVLPTDPGLAPFVFSDDLLECFSRLSGLSIAARVETPRASFTESILFTHRGLSGPAVLQASSHWRPGEPVRLDLAPGRDLVAELRDARSSQPRALPRSVLAELLPRRLVLELESLFWPGEAEKPLAEWSNAALGSLASSLHGWELRPAGTEGYRTAEVTLGGVDTTALSSKTMESRVSGLFFIGEVVDVTGELGGFNFQWAWSSGYAAGCAV